MVNMAHFFKQVILAETNFDKIPINTNVNIGVFV